jgi:hypothetical protein
MVYTVTYGMVYGWSTRFASLMRMLCLIQDDPINLVQCKFFVSLNILQFFIMSKNIMHIYESLQRSTRRNAMSWILKGPCSEIQVSGQEASAFLITGSK